MKGLMSVLMISGSFINIWDCSKKMYRYFMVNTQSDDFYFTGWAYLPIAFGSF